MSTQQDSMLNPSNRQNGKRQWDNHCREIHTPIYSSIKESQPSHPNAKKISPGEMRQCSKIVCSFIYRPGWVSSSASWKCNHGATSMFAPLTAPTVMVTLSVTPSALRCLLNSRPPHVDMLWLGFPLRGWMQWGWCSMWNIKTPDGLVVLFVLQMRHVNER